MPQGDRDHTSERGQLRERLQKQGHTPEQIAAAMTREFEDRPRVAWRYAHGWTQQDVADRYNREVNDPNASMTAHRISDFERWPINNKGIKPTVPTLGVLAKIYSTKISRLLDRHDRQKMTNAELITCGIVDSGIIPQQLPATISNFVGRTHELDILTAQLDRAAVDDNTVVITSIGGTAGIGKTTLALYWARTHIDRWPDGQLYVDLRGFSPSGSPVTPQEAIRGFLDAFQIPPDRIPVNFDAQTALYRTLVEGRRLVIVLDNARDADQIWPLLPGGARCTVIVTSRQQLGSLIARKRALHITLELMTTEEARQLLTDFLGSERIQAEPEAVDELIQYCIGLPIALTIAAARIQIEPHTSLSTLVSQLREERQRLDALSTGEDSQLTDIRAVFSWSYTALSPQAARLFRLLGVHPGPDIDRYAAASLAGLPERETNKLLTTLTRTHLLKEHTPGRYQFHDLLRVYATERATDEEPEPQQHTAIRRELDHYLHTGCAAARYLAPNQDPINPHALSSGVTLRHIANYEQALKWFTVEHANLLTVTNYAAARGFNTHAWQLPLIFATFLARQGHWHDWIATQQIALASARLLNERAAQARSHRILGRAYALLGDYDQAHSHLQDAINLYQATGDQAGQAAASNALSMLYEQQSQYTLALNHAQHALALYRAVDNHTGEALAENQVGWCHALLGHFPQALTHCHQALIRFRDLNGPGKALTLGSLGYAHHHLNQYDEAITYYKRAVTLWRELSDYYEEAHALTRLGDTYRAKGDFAAARQSWQYALTIFDRLNRPDAEHVRTQLTNLDNHPNK